MVVTVLALVFASLIVATRGFHGEARSVSDAQGVLQTSNELQRTVIDVETGLRGYLLTGEDRFLEPFDDGLRLIPIELQDLHPHVTEPDQRARLAGLDTRIQSYVDGYAVPQRMAGPGVGRRRIRGAASEGKRLVDAVRESFDAFDRAEERLVSHRRDAAELRGAIATATGVGGMILSVVMLIGLGWYLRRFVIAPVRRVADAADRLARGDRRSSRTSARRSRAATRSASAAPPTSSRAPARTSARRSWRRCAWSWRPTSRALLAASTSSPPPSRRPSRRSARS